MILEPIFYGFLLGFALCFTFGPVFFALIQTSIEQGFRRALLIVTGVTVGDGFLFFTVIFGTSFLPKIQNFNLYLGWAGALLLLVLGVMSLRSKRKDLVYPQSRLGSLVFYFSKGLFLNLLNPSNYVAVFGTSVALRNSLNYDTTEVILFFTASLVATFVAEALIAHYAIKLKRLLTPGLIDRINQLAGLVFIVSGLRLMYGLVF
jgi:threonine/homoserine/homoserine lactone efflux protein